MESLLLILLIVSVLFNIAQLFNGRGKDGELKALKDDLTKVTDKKWKIYWDFHNYKENLIVNSFKYTINVDYSKITIDSKLLNISELRKDEKIYPNRKIVQLPDGKYQILMLSPTGLVLGSTQMGIVDTFAEVVEYIKGTSYIILE